MSNIRFLNKKAHNFARILQHSNKPLLIVTCSLVNSALMTAEAYSVLRDFMDTADQQSVVCLEIMPESAANLGFQTVWTVEDILHMFGRGPAA